MSRRFDGAITTPDDEWTDSSIPPEPARPRRPPSIELAAAILIVGAMTDILGSLAWASGGPTASEPGARPIVALLLALNILTVVVGVLVRTGRAWLVCINVVAVLVFVESMAIADGSVLAVLLAALDGFVFVTLTRQRDWFGWRPPPAMPGSDLASPDDA